MYLYMHLDYNAFTFALVDLVAGTPVCTNAQHLYICISEL